MVRARAAAGTQRDEAGYAGCRAFPGNVVALMHMTTYRRCTNCGSRVPQGKRCGCRPSTTGGANARGYTYQWQQDSKRWLDQHPLCGERADGKVHSDGCGRVVVRGKARGHKRKGHVDHITPHEGDSRRFWDQDNWQTLCATCHAVKTGRES